MSAAPPRPVAVIPVYNNGTTVARVIEETRRFLPEIIVVDDGSRDETSSALKKLEYPDRITFSRNRGKGCALRAGLGRARERGFTHVIAIDADGQHCAEDLPVFLERLAGEPETLWIGSRSLPGPGTVAPLRSRFGRKFGAFWYRFHTGLTIDDTQCGFRVYPLETISGLSCRGERYEFEIDILIRAAWRGIPVKQVPIRLCYLPPGQAVSHFRPVRDFLRISRINSRAAVTKIFLPFAAEPPAGKTWREKLAQLLRRELTANMAPARAAASLAIGVTVGISPTYGFQMVTIAMLSFLFRLNRPLALLGVSVSSPPMLPLLIAAGIALGRAVLPPTMAQGGPAALRYGMAWFVGSALLSAAAGAVTFLAALLFFRRVRSLRKRKVGHGNTEVMAGRMAQPDLDAGRPQKKEGGMTPKKIGAT